MSHRFAIGTDLSQEDNPETVPYLTNDTVAFFWGASAKGYRYHNSHQATYNTYDYTGSLNFNPTSTLSSRTSLGIQYYQRKDAFIQGENVKAWLDGQLYGQRDKTMDEKEQAEKKPEDDKRAEPTHA